MIKDRNYFEMLRSYLLIAAGTGLMAFAIKSSFDPIGLVTGGFTGIGIMLRRLTADFIEGGIPIWFTNILLNAPLFLVAFRRTAAKGRRVSRAHGGGIPVSVILARRDTGC